MAASAGDARSRVGAEERSRGHRVAVHQALGTVHPDTRTHGADVDGFARETEVVAADLDPLRVVEAEAHRGARIRVTKSGVVNADEGPAVHRR